MKSFSFDHMRTADAYKLITGVIQPRPIAWVSTVDRDGVRNLAPFSFFTIASRDPVTLFLSIGATDRPGHETKDTLANVLATGELVVNVVSAPALGVMAETSADVPSHIDEFEFVGLDAAASTEVAPPRVAQALVAIECRLDSVQQVGTDTAILARALRLHAREDVVNSSHHIDTSVLRPVGRTAGATYCADATSIPSPAIPRWHYEAGAIR
jgi:flavin reductase (DIM6/NTAB) family NADH-FMN oxidoreductase RutF